MDGGSSLSFFLSLFVRVCELGALAGWLVAWLPCRVSLALSLVLLLVSSLGGDGCMSE
jgi:hypothetical protein